MKEYSRKCPIDFHDMFYEEELPASWDKLEPKQILELLPYEGFFQGSYTANQILRLLETQIAEKEKEEIETVLNGYVEEQYRLKWAPYPEAEEPRILFCSGKQSAASEEASGDVRWFVNQLKKAGFGCGIHPKNLQIRITAPNGDLAMVLLPCCPRCFTILPTDWFCAEDYVSIALLAPRVTGKTTLMASWMCKNNEGFEILNRIGHDGKVGGYRVVRGIKPEYFKVQNFHHKNADRLCNRYGKGDYPEKATDIMRIPPVYFKITKNGKILLVGVYDCSGEVLADVVDDNTAAGAFLGGMSSFIYMVAPESMYNIAIPIKNKEQKEPISLLSLEEQAKLQMADHPGVSASDLIDIEELRQGVDPWWVYRQVRQYLDENECESRKRHIAYTLIHSDELCDLAEVKAVTEAQNLFENPPRRQILDESYLAYTNYVAKALFGRLVFEGTQEEWEIFSHELEKEFCEYDENDEYVSWHCISAAYYDKTGQYRYIRKMDPLIGCIYKKLKLLG